MKCDKNCWVLLCFCRNYFPKHQAALIVPSPEPTTVQRTTGPTANVSSVSSNGAPTHLMGMIPGGNQFAQTANQIQTSNQIQSNAYMGGRLTPQAMQQGLFLLLVHSLRSRPLVKNPLY